MWQVSLYHEIRMSYRATNVTGLFTTRIPFQLSFQHNKAKVLIQGGSPLRGIKILSKNNNLKSIVLSIRIDTSALKISAAFSADRILMSHWQQVKKYFWVTEFDIGLIRFRYASSMLRSFTPLKILKRL